MDPLSKDTANLFKKNRLVGHFSYVRPSELVPNFFTRGTFFLSRQGDTLVATMNSCLHRGYKLVTERQTTKTGAPVTCRFHGWTYEKETGKLIDCPGFGDRIVDRCLNQVPLIESNGMFFEADSVRSINDLGEFFNQIPVNMKSFTFDQENVAFYQVTWKTIMEVYLTSYNMRLHTPGLGAYLGDNVSTKVGKEYSIRIFDICEWKSDIGPITPGTTMKEMISRIIPNIGWSKFRDEVVRVGWTESWSAILGVIYPGLMIEFYPHVMVINQLVPLSNKMTASYVQIFYDEVATLDYNFQNAFTEAYSETAQEVAFLQDILEDGRINADIISKGCAGTNRSHYVTHIELERCIRELEVWEARNDY